MQKLNRNIGSSFYALQEDDWEYQVLSENKVPLNLQHSFYYSGRNAFLAILKEIEKQSGFHTIWLPNYYCDTVINMIQEHYSDIQFYTINPFGQFDSQVNFKSFANSNDVVILNNFWGLSSFDYDTTSKDSPIIIEDHTHGWLSKQSLNSKADYCICAIRKYYPIPTGGIAWKPNSNDSVSFANEIEDKDILKAWDKFSQSMTLKRSLIKSGDETVTSNYLALYSEGDQFLNTSHSYVKPSQNAIAMFKKYIDKDPSAIKAKHLHLIHEGLDISKHFKVIKREGYIPFGLLLLFKNEDLFLSFKKELVSKGIFPAHLWPNNTSDSEWKYIFNIHVDFRYTMDDMNYIVKVVNHWSNTNA